MALDHAASLVIYPHPLTAAGRQTMSLPRSIVEAGMCLADILTAAGQPPPDAYIMYRNGRMVMTETWDSERVGYGDIITVRATPLGGDDSDPLRVILQIALLVAAFYIPTTAWFTRLGPVAQAGVSAAVAVGGTLLINAVAPVRVPKAEQGPAEARPASIQGGSNRARHHQPMMLIFGRMRVFPDLASNEYTYFQRPQWVPQRQQTQYVTECVEYYEGDHR